MDQKELIEHFKKDPSSLESIMQSEDGKQLMQMLSGSDGGNALQKATAKASAGNITDMVQLIRNVMSSPNGSAVVQRIHDSLQK